jgi:hypothetical protein
MKNKLYLLGILILILCANAFAQLTLPRESQRSEVTQTIGDTRVSLVYHRPNIKGRKVWGEAPKEVANGTATLDNANTRLKDAPLVPYGHVWRVGANENTTFEVTNDIKVNGQILPAGKYGLHAIPNQNEWIIIFNKVNNAWGSFTYDAKNDQLRITAKPEKGEFQESMSLGVENIKATTADVVIRWENVRVPFTVDVGDMTPRILANIRGQVANVKADNAGIPVQGARWVFDNKLTANYEEALTWVDKSLALRETYAGLNLKAQLLAATGKKAEAIATAEKAIQVGKAATPAANTTSLEKMLADWKAGK